MAGSLKSRVNALRRAGEERLRRAQSRPATPGAAPGADAGINRGCPGGRDPRRWVSSSCRHSAPTWTPARSRNGSSNPATVCTAATSSRSSTPTRPRSTSRSSKTAWSTRSSFPSARRCPSARRWPRSEPAPPVRRRADRAADARSENRGLHPPHPGPPADPDPPDPVPTARRHRPRAALHSPVLRRLARHLAVDLEAVSAAGPAAPSPAPTSKPPRVRAEGVATGPAATPGASRPAVSATTARSGLAMRDAIARLMARSKREIPHYYLGTDVDFSRAREWLDQANAERPVTDRLLPAVLLVKAVALATRKVPGMNGFWLDRYQASDAVNVGVAISLPRRRPDRARHPRRRPEEPRRAHARPARPRRAHADGPAAQLRDVRAHDHGDQPRRAGCRDGPRRDLPAPGRAGRLRQDHRAPVGRGRDARGPARRLDDTLAADHRASDGHTGARFLAQIDRLLQAPETV